MSGYKIFIDVCFFLPLFYMQEVASDASDCPSLKPSLRDGSKRWSDESKRSRITFEQGSQKGLGNIIIVMITLIRVLL